MTNQLWRNTAIKDRVKLIKSVYSHECCTAVTLGSALKISPNTVRANYEKYGDQLTAYPLITPKKEKPKPVVETYTPEPHNPDYMCRRVELLDIETKDCRWPVEDGPPLLMCGNRISEHHTSYCPYHAKLSYGPGSVSERNALNGLGIKKNAITSARI